MKNTLMLVFLTSYMCTNTQAQKDYERIIDGLRKNYVINGSESIGRNNKFVSDSVKYYTALNDFYNADESIISFLLSRYEKCQGLSDLIVPHSPKLSSTLSPCELADCKLGAIILIDNYLLRDSKDRIICKDYLVNKLSAEIFGLYEVFFTQNKRLKGSDLKRKYESVLLKKVRE